MVTQEKRTNLKKPNSDRTGHGFRVKFNPLALLLDASLEGEFDLVQRIIYEVSWFYSHCGGREPLCLPFAAAAAAALEQDSRSSKMLKNIYKIGEKK